MPSESSPLRPRSAFAVWPADADRVAAAEALARELGLPRLPVSSDGPAAPAGSLLLILGATRLELREIGPRAPGPVFADFLGELQRELAGPGAGRRRDLARAAGLAPGASLEVVDATAGFGRDAFRLASLGCRVIAVERSPVVAALLADGLRRAASDSRTAATVAERLRLVAGDARQVLRQQPPPEVVLVDPMYPPARKDAAPGKELRLLRRLLGADDDAGELLAVAREVARRRVVVKRRVHDPPLDGARPDLSWTGRSTRFDVYLSPHLGK